MFLYGRYDKNWVENVSFITNTDFILLETFKRKDVM